MICRWCKPPVVISNPTRPEADTATRKLCRPPGLVDRWTWSGGLHHRQFLYRPPGSVASGLSRCEHDHTGFDR